MDKGLVLKISLGIGVTLLVIAFLYFFYGGGDATGMMIILLVMGSFGFLPIGLLLGAMMFDITMRIKVLRTITKKNLGIVNIVSGNQVFRIIKDFNNDMIELNKNLYYLKKDKIYNDKDEVLAELKDENIKFIGGIPSIYFDLKNLLPVKFYEDKIEVTPEELSAPIKAWIITKEAELLRWKRATQISLIVLIAVVGIAIYFSYQNNGLLQDQVIPMLKQIVSTPSVVSQPPAPG